MPRPESSRGNESVVRRYLTALNQGHVLDALNTFGMDAEMRDWAGRERHGIREIAAAFAGREHPVQVEVERLETRGDAVMVRLRVIFAGSHESRIYRSEFHVTRDRIRSLLIEPVPSRRTPEDRAALSA